MMRTRARLAARLLLLLVLAVPGAAGAGSFDPQASSLEIFVSDFPAFQVGAGGGGGADLTPAGLFLSPGVWSGSGTLGTGAFTGVPLITHLAFDLGNASGTFTYGFSSANPVGNLPIGGGGQLAGWMHLTGTIVLGALGGFVTFPIPMDFVGQPGTGALTKFSYGLTLSGAGWAAGPGQVTVRTDPMHPVVVTLTRTGGVFTTPGGGTDVVLVTPFRMQLDILAGNLPGFAVQTLHFAPGGPAVPEPGTLLLTTAGLLGLGLARRRARRSPG